VKARQEAGGRRQEDYNPILKPDLVLEHYLRFGQNEKRSPSSLFDEGDYLSVNPDVGQAVSAGIFSSGFAHYILHGRAENRLIFA